METTSSFGYWVRRRRKALDLTQTELARLVCCTLSTIKKIESDERRPSHLMAERLAECLQVPTAEREEFIKIARAEHSPERLAMEGEPLTANTSVEVKTNLPLPANRLIGRLRQIEEISGLLRNPEVRMVTLIGPGGVGKTRLATHIGTFLFPEFPDGCWLVELAPISDPVVIAQEISSTLGIQDSSGKPPLVTLASHLQKKHLLLIMDNCEHLLEACARVAHALLTSSKQLVILCTSREAVNIPEEYIWQVSPLELPDKALKSTLDELSQNEAINLFLDRARHVIPSFEITEQNKNAIMNICHRLDGLPLAIELAAARIRVLSPDQIEGMLDNVIKLLEGGYRTSDIRQQTMYATIDWSFTSLSKSEQALLMRLSTFAGSWTLEAAEETCSTSGISREELPTKLTKLHRDDIFGLLNKLVNKSLVTIGREQEQEVRYYLLETIRQYGQIKLLETGEMDLIRQRHLEFYMSWAEMISPELHKVQQIAWLEFLDIELENLRLALAWGLKASPIVGLRLASALYRFWRVRNLYVEGVEWLTKFLDLPENKAPTAYRARALGVLSSLGIFMTPSPETWAVECLEISESLHDESTRALALWMLGSIQYYKYENFELGRTYLLRSLEAYRSINDHWGMAQVLYHLANLAIYKGDALGQRKYLEQSLELYREVGDIRGIAATLDNLASAVADIEADLRTGQRLVEEALAMYRQLNARSSMHNALYVYAYILAWRGEYQLARQVLQERLDIVQQSGIPLNTVLARVLLAGLDRLAGNVEKAEIILDECLRTTRASDPRLVQSWHYARNLHELAYIRARQEKTDSARDLIQEALEKSDMPEERAILFHCLGTVALVEQKGNEALGYFKESLEICTKSYFKLTAILAMEGLANALCSEEKYELSIRFLGATAKFRSRIGAPVSPWDDPGYESLKALLLDKVSAIAYDNSWSEGQALSFDKAVEEALTIRAFLAK